MKLLAIITIVFGLLRVFLPASGTINQADVFKDLAHVFVGVLFGCAGMASYAKHVQYVAVNDAWKLWLLAWGLTALEVVAFLAKKSS